MMSLSKVFNLKAFLYHFLFSIVLIGGLALFIVHLWYPGIWATEIGGYQLVWMIVMVDLCVGPLCVGFAYKPHKSRKEKILDISVITLCQLAFFAWGAWTISISRPVFIAFDADRFELVVDQEVSAENLANTAPFDRLPLFEGLKMAVVDVEQTVPDQEARIQVNNDALFGLDISKQPKYYVPYEDNIDRVLKMAKGYEDFAKNGEATQAAADFMAKHVIEKAEFMWLPIRYFSPEKQSPLFMTAVIDPKTAQIIDYIVIDPYEINE
ncbi:hypothetical protein B9T21_09525 [Wohlfahrtiimonas chitiniclastica]|nr:hypothetical protein A6V30_07525 [Wohlfahrtiimonas chitiniclastica]OYQ86921.1 hypothetical protein B9T21_09525 [Wohlfahrtiimonas chitiniclastica]